MATGSPQETSSPAPPRLSRAESKARTRARVLEAAEAVFRRDGYHGASLERIAAQAGYTKGAVYSTFDSKADVMLALVAARAARRRDEMATIFDAASDAWEALGEFARRFAPADEAERDWWAAVVEFMVVVGRDEELRARYAEHHDATREAVVAMTRRWTRESGDRLTISPEQLAAAAMALSIGLTVEGMLAPTEVSASLYADAQLALRRGALGGREGHDV
ncbi:MAG: TetR/AcrR family transcriptional regulator [Solirubrobacterales bacterium]